MEIFKEMSSIRKAKNLVQKWIDDYQGDMHFSKALAIARLQERIAGRMHLKK